MLQETLYNPITKHLKNIETKLQNPNSSVGMTTSTTTASTRTVPEDLKSQQHETKREDGSADSDTVWSTPNFPHKRRLSFKSTTKRKLSTRNNYEDDDNNDEPSSLKRSIIADINSDYEDNESEYNYNIATNNSEKNRFDDIAEKSFTEYLEQYDVLPRKYISDMYNDTTNKEFDHKYGIRLDKDIEKFMIGDSQLQFVDADVYVKGKRYKGTHGLYELLFKKRPNGNIFNAEDLKNYRQIIIIIIIIIIIVFICNMTNV
ncbi:unnamed protein product [Callosobruchus maculatus]|uniref:DUF8207 domain-containing protein n=1 Tax=Callosobruchus maculatus TaxID=64391 RepID=A0A653DIN0_CALMS|nr:unnamed protein product [Callosobruchus maculatus]